MPAFDAKDKSRFETFSRRSLLVSGGMTAVFAVLVGRLYQLQIVQGDEYMTAAEDNRINQRLLAPPRGRIFDRFGVALASNRRNYRALIVPEQAPEGMAAALTTLAKVIPISDHQRARVMRDVAANKPFVPVTIAENLPWDDFSRLNLDLPYLPGVQPDVGETRDYPFGLELSHVLGYVAPVSPEDKARAADDDPLMDIPGFRIGKRGIEKAYDIEVRGSAGSSRVEVNAYGRVIRELARQPGQLGDEIYLTIDRELQRYAHELMQDQSAACALLDVATGDVLALVSTPGYDPNAFNVGLTPEQWKALTEDDHKPLLNKVLSGTYPPGSTFKPVTALAAVESGAISPDFSVVCGGAFALGSRVFHCWKRGGHGRMNLRAGIQHSCDVFFYTAAQRTGIDALEATARKLGLGAPSGIEIPGEKGGLIPSQAWKLATFHEPWQPGETVVAGIGQGFTVVTPLQLALVAARIASGKKLEPRIVHTVGTRAQPRVAPEPLAISEEALAIVRDGMGAVTNEVGGTAYTWRIPDEGFEMAGKPGTAQVRVISAAEHASGVRKNETLPWKLRDHALFIAYAPVAAPRYACAVLIEHGAVAAHPQVQIARDLLLRAQQRDPVRMPTAYPANAASVAAART